MKMIVSLCVCVCVCGWIGEWELLYYGENPLTLRVVVVTVGYQLSIVWTIGVGVTVYKFPAKQFYTLFFFPSCVCFRCINGPVGIIGGQSTTVVQTEISQQL